MEADAFVIAFTPNTILSNGSTTVSSRFFVEIVIVPDGCPFAIRKVLLDTVYSPDSTAVPDVWNSIVISLSEATEGVAVKVKSVAEFSTIVGELNLKLTTGNSSLSTIEIVLEIALLRVTFVVVSVVNINDFVSSSVKSFTPFTLICPVKSPALIAMIGFLPNF